MPLRLAPEAVFENFTPGPNFEAVSRLREPMGGSLVWIWGAASAGKSHLLQAACAHWAEQGLRVIYVGRADVARYGAALLDGLGRLDLVALDGMEAVLQEDGGEAALFRLYNELLSESGGLLLSSRVGPGDLSVGLRDLSSRLHAGLIYKLNPIRGDDQVEAVVRRARINDLRLSARAAEYLLNRINRDMTSVCAWLDALDEAALAQKRQLTIPFIRQVLGRAAAQGGDDGGRVDNGARRQ